MRLASPDVRAALAEELRREFGTRYQVFSYPLPDAVPGLEVAGRPDLLLVPREGGRTIMVEVEGGTLSDNLSIGEADHALTTLLKNKALHPRVVLVSTSSVDRMIRGVLAGAHIDVVVTDRPREAVSRVISLIHDA